MHCIFKFPINYRVRIRENVKIKKSPKTRKFFLDKITVGRQNHDIQSKSVG